MATRAAKKKTRRKGNVYTFDFTGVKSGGATIPDGRYEAKIIAAEEKEGQESGEPYTELTWEITSDKCNGREVKFDNYSHQPQALWRIKSLLEAMGVEVPDGEQEVDFDEMISHETECIIEVTGQKSSDGDRTYARVTGHAPLSDGNTVDDDGEEEEEDDPKESRSTRGSGKTTRTRSNDDGDDDSDEPPKRRKPKDEEEEEEEPPKRRGKKDEEEEEEDDDEPPRRGKIKKGAKVKFKDEKNKPAKGTIESIDGDTATVVTDDDDTYEIDIDELTVIG